MQAWLLSPVLLLLPVFAFVFSAQAQSSSPAVDPFKLSDTPQSIAALALQTDGKVIAGGLSFFLARYLSDGTRDTLFNPNVNATVYSLALQPDGKILVGGDFTSLSGASRNYIGRLNTNGTIDNVFIASLLGRAQCLALQVDGKILVAGKKLGTAPPPLPPPTVGYVTRLTTNGTTDNAFSSTTSINGPVAAMVVQDDGKVIIGGLFNSVAGQSRVRLARLNSNGTLDTTFNPGADGLVTALAVQPDGLILVGGNFNTVAGQPRTNIARLNADGSLDNSFDPGVTGTGIPTVYSLSPQADGKIIFSGLFNAVGGHSRANLARILADGSLDTSYASGANSTVLGLGGWEDGRLQAAGDFSTLGGAARNRSGRFLPAEPAAESLTLGASSVTWLRGGSAPEVTRTTFETSTNLTQWTLLGPGSRIPGGWEINGVSLPADARVRARGFVAGGAFNASSWFVETVSGPCYFASQPASRTNNAGTAVLLSAIAEGSPTLVFQWLKNGAPLQDGGSISGAQSANLVIAPAFAVDQGSYSLIASNASGSITSSPAFLRVLDPVVTSVFFTNYANLGDNLSWSVNATGTPPLALQWVKNGTDLAGATSTLLSLSNAQPADAGMYSVRVSNVFTTMTSNRVYVEVNAALPDNFAPNVTGDVRGIAEQTDGSVIFSGFFTGVNGNARSSLARVDSAGALQAAYDLQTRPNDALYALGILPDETFLVGGGFLLTNLTTTNLNLARITQSGTLDPTFSPPPANTILAMARQTNGMMLVGGWLQSPTGMLARIDAHGLVDTNFDPNPLFDVIRTIAVQPDGAIVVGGGFGTIGGQPRAFIARLTAAGNADMSFNPGANSYVNCIAIQPDGMILLGGEFTTIAGQGRSNLARLLPSGALDGSFKPAIQNFPSANVYSIVLQADGKILVGGQFSSINGVARGNVARLLPSGAVDPTFNPLAQGNAFIPIVEGLGVMSDGKTLVAGAFDTLAGQPRGNLGRLQATEPATQSLTYNGSAITWLRGGTSPEVWFTTFEYSTNNTDWLQVGNGARIAGGWHLANVPLAERSTLRARGYTTGGNYNASSWFVESQMLVVTRPLILTSDPSFGISSNHFQFPVQAGVGQTVVIEASSNLQSWVPLSTNPVSASIFQFSDPTPANGPGRFYRVRVVAQ